MNPRLFHTAPIKFVIFPKKTEYGRAPKKGKQDRNSAFLAKRNLLWRKIR